MSSPVGIGRLGVLDLDFLAAERQLAAFRAGRGEEPHGGGGEVALLKQRAHHLAHLTGGTYNTD